MTRHNAFIKSLPCVSCGATRQIDQAHVRASVWGEIVVPRDERGGMGAKPAGHWTVPLCRRCHQRQHQTGERTFWGRLGINPLELARELSEHTGHRLVCMNRIERRRNGATDV